MNIKPTRLPGAYRIDPEVHLDERGEFWRSYCRKDLATYGIEFDPCQNNVSVNPHQHTLRGFHYQCLPSNEQKILTVIVGALHLVVVDIRPDSPTFMDHESFHFKIGDRSSFLVPAGCATGFLTLVNDTIVHYQMDDYYQPENYMGFRYDDPSIGVEWPTEPAVVSDRDRGFADLDLSAL